MRNKIISLLLSFVLTANIVGFLISFIDSKPPPKPKSSLEAPLLQAWIAWYQFIKAGGTWWGGGDVRLKPKSDGN